MLLVALMGLAGQAPEPVEAVIAEYRDKTRAAITCRAAEDDDEILVCARRDADRYRVPFVVAAERDSVPLQTARALDGKTFVCGITGPFFRGCGAAGVTMTIGGDGAVKVRTRPLAP